jgi:heat shock protein HslJ
MLFYKSLKEILKMKKRFLTLGLTLVVTLVLVGCNAAITPAPSLTGKVWVLTQIDDLTTGKKLKPTGGTIPTLEFKEDGTVSGHGGCNTFGGGYDVGANNALQVKDLFSTLMACPDMDTEAIYLDALGMASAFTLQNDQLQLSTSDGSALLTFVVQKP